MITVTDLSKTYGKKKNIFQVLKNIKFDIPDGASVAIIGKSGSGKSTLMHVMSGLDRAQTGQVVVDGQDILQFKRKQSDRFRAETMGFIFQSFFVQANETAYNNVSLPLEIAKVAKNKRKAKIEQALDSVGLLDKKKNQARDLSGGEKQRLAVARAIVNQPTLLFADEPTGNLDSVTGEKIEKLLFSYNRDHKVTLIVVTHDHDLAEQCDQQIHLKDGQIVKITGNKGKKK